MGKRKQRTDLLIDFGPDLRPRLRAAARGLMLTEAAVVRAAVRAELRRLEAENGGGQVVGQVSAECQEPVGQS